MDLIGGRVSGGPLLPGGAEMRELALGALAALERANLGDAARAVRERVFGCDAEELVEAYEENDMPRWRFKPMAELVLRELSQIAKADQLSLAERRRRIEWALEMAGF